MTNPNWKEMVIFQNEAEGILWRESMVRLLQSPERSAFCSDISFCSDICDKVVLEFRARVGSEPNLK